jgi:hypothetical protein
VEGHSAFREFGCLRLSVNAYVGDCNDRKVRSLHFEASFVRRTFQVVNSPFPSSTINSSKRNKIACFDIIYIYIYIQYILSVHNTFFYLYLYKRF